MFGMKVSVECLLYTCEMIIYAFPIKEVEWFLEELISSSLKIL